MEEEEKEASTNAVPWKRDVAVAENRQLKEKVKGSGQDAIADMKICGRALYVCVWVCEWESGLVCG